MHFSNREILKITMPVLLSLLMEQLIGITDTAYLGRVGEVELGASALAGVFYMFIYMLAFGFSIGGQVLMARRNGEGEYRKIGSIFSQGVLFLLFLATVMFAASKLWAPAVLRQIIESDHVFKATMDYIDWRVYGFFFSFTATMFRAFYVATTQTRILTINSLVMVGTNVVLNYILIFGKLGCPAMGIAGAAIASSISEAVSLLYFLIHTSLKVDTAKYNLAFLCRPDFKALKRILNVSVWIMFQHAFATLSWFIFFVAIEHLGERPLAITNIVRSLTTFLYMIVNAFSSTSSSMVSNLIGMGKSEFIMPFCRRMILLCSVFVAAVVALILLFPTQVLGIYTDNAELIEASRPTLLVMLGSFVICTPAVIYQFSVAGTGDTRASMSIVLTAIVVYMIFTFFVAGVLRADVAVCWTADYIYYLALLIAYFYLRSGRWRKRVI